SPTSRAVPRAWWHGVCGPTRWDGRSRRGSRPSVLAAAPVGTGRGRPSPPAPTLSVVPLARWHGFCAHAPYAGGVPSRARQVPALDGRDGTRQPEREAAAPNTGAAGPTLPVVAPERATVAVVAPEER